MEKGCLVSVKERLAWDTGSKAHAGLGARSMISSAPGFRKVESEEVEIGKPCVEEVSGNM